MILIEKTEVMGFDHAIRGMRNPMNSWDKSDSSFEEVFEDSENLHNYYMKSVDIGPNDHELMMKLVKGGPVHAKFRRMITVYVDITAPLYWWKEFDTYKVGTVTNSCSTMHKIHEKEFTIEDFSHEHLTGKTDGLWVNADGKDFMCSAYDFCQITCDVLNFYRQKYLKTNDKKFWWQIIQLLPSSYNQKRTVMLNYEVLAGIYEHRKSHKLDEWKEFCKWIEGLPYSEIITGIFTSEPVEDVDVIDLDLACGKNMMVSLLNPYGEYVIEFAKNHDISIDEAHQHPTCKARLEYFIRTGR